MANPATKHYISHDVFTHITSIPIKDEPDEWKNEITQIVGIGDTLDRKGLKVIVESIEEAQDFPLEQTVELSFPELNTEESFLKGVVHFIDPRVDAASGLLEIRILADNPDRLVKPGLRARVAVIAENQGAKVDELKGFGSQTAKLIESEPHK